MICDLETHGDAYRRGVAHHNSGHPSIARLVAQGERGNIGFCVMPDARTDVAEYAEFELQPWEDYEREQGIEK